MNKNSELIEKIKSGMTPLVKITPKFNLEQSIDPGFIIRIFDAKVSNSSKYETVVEFKFEIPNPEYCEKFAKKDWYDFKQQPPVANLSYFDVHTPNKFGVFCDSLYVDEEPPTLNTWEDAYFRLEKLSAKMSEQLIQLTEDFKRLNEKLDKLNNNL